MHTAPAHAHVFVVMGAVAPLLLSLAIGKLPLRCRSVLVAAAGERRRAETAYQVTSRLCNDDELANHSFHTAIRMGATLTLMTVSVFCWPACREECLMHAKRHIRTDRHDGRLPSCIVTAVALPQWQL